MAITVDEALLDSMKRCSDSIRVEVRDANDPDAALRGVQRAARAIMRIPHPDQPDEPYASYVSAVRAGPRGPTLRFDMADAEAYGGILERSIDAIVTSLEQAGVVDAVVTWPESSAQRATTWSGRFVDDWDDRLERMREPPPPEHLGDPRREAVRRTTTRGWSTCSPLPTVRSWPGVTWGPDGRVYVVGGQGQIPVKTVEAYDASTDSWSRVAPLVVPRRGPGVAVAAGWRLCVVGGYDSRRDGVTTVEAYDVQADRWELVAPMTGRAFNHVAATTGPDGRIYALALATRGAPSPGDPHVFESYEADGDRWTPLAPPSGCYQSDVVLFAGPQGRIFTAGWGHAAGADGHRPVPAIAPLPSLVMESYEASSDRWETVSPPPKRMLAWRAAAKVALPPPPAPRASFAMAAGPDGRIYAVGGTAAWAPLATVEVYEPDLGAWVAADPMPTPREAPAVTVAPDGTVFVIGGFGDAREPLPSVEAYRP